jgi:hypothetical protein
MSPQIDLVGSGRMEELLHWMRVRLAGVGIEDDAIVEEAWRLVAAIAPRTLEPATTWVEFLVSAICNRIVAKSLEAGLRP